MKDAQVPDKYDCIRIGNQICFPLYACAKEIVRQYREPLKALELTYTQYIVMMVLWEYGDMTEGELGKIVRLDSGTLAPLLKRLEKQGYINRIRPDDNERKLLISLSEEGSLLKDKALEVPRKVSACLKISEEELVQLKTILDKLMLNMN